MTRIRHARRMLPELSPYSGIIVFMAATLSLINPFLCIVHCMAFDSRPEPRGAYTGFVCHLSVTPQAEAPANPNSIGHRPVLPRAVYESALAPFTLLLILAPLAMLTTRSFSRIHDEFPPPPAPPPKYLVF